MHQKDQGRPERFRKGHIGLPVWGMWGLIEFLSVCDSHLFLPTALGAEEVSWVLAVISVLVLARLPATRRKDREWVSQAGSRLLMNLGSVLWPPWSYHWENKRRISCCWRESNKVRSCFVCRLPSAHSTQHEQTTNTELFTRSRKFCPSWRLGFNCNWLY